MAWKGGGRGRADKVVHGLGRQVRLLMLGEGGEGRLRWLMVGGMSGGSWSGEVWYSLREWVGWLMVQGGEGGLGSS